jgi:hypothetical protein
MSLISSQDEKHPAPSDDFLKDYLTRAQLD